MALPAIEPWIALPPDTTDEPVRALYIGGDHGLADLYKLKLEMDGYWVTLAATGTEGLARVRERVPDIVFLDLGPADESLLHMLRTLRRDRDLKEIPVVVLWRGGADQPTIQGLRLGVQDFLVKANITHPEHLPASSNLISSGVGWPDKEVGNDGEVRGAWRLLSGGMGKDDR